ncbi:hypothetical protein DH2020_000128 [Rehmannia glutinosa]|uniref:tRNA-intron lyase n=1 Tax=Rehmannia glutinosa TaxID=99300 RepID=A0ABR0XVQ8_REHGL
MSYYFPVKQIMAPRWKGKAAEAKAFTEPITHPEQTDLFNRACFGRPIITAENDKQWFQLSPEEALYLHSVMKCIQIVGENKCVKDEEELWRYTTSKKAGFPFLFKAYTHLRTKNWVVRGGCQYGVDFVAYRHHPALVWSEFYCTLRLCGSVAKTLLVLHVSRNGNGAGAAICISSLENYCVEERIVTRWNPQQGRENETMVEKLAI